MKVELDLAKCQGYANCVVEAPEIFDIDEDNGKAIILMEEIPESAHEEARRAVASCPVAALRAVD